MFRILLICLAITSISNCAIVNANEPGSQDWWKTAVFYQIYPRSFKDSNNDGIGDLQGIVSKLDHLKNIGVTATWLSPIFASPQVDQGYDISDYLSISPEYGTLEDFGALLDKAKELGIKIILDFVPNHTSDEHEWFQKSVSKDAKYKDFYIWKDGDENTPPNNWVSEFKGSAWTYHKTRGQWYLHQFAEAQPDLNYRNPNVVKAMADVLTFWLKKGVAGFRIDAVPFLFEDESLADEPLSGDPDASPNDYEYLNHTLTKDQPETYELIYEWRKLMDDFTKENGGDARVIMTEAYTTFENTLLYYGSPDGKELGAHFTFNFDFITNLKNTSTSSDIKEIIDQWIKELPAYYVHNWVLGNHDNHRVANRFGEEHVDALNMLQAILPGVQVNYNGEEIGMEDGNVNCSQGHDPQAINNCSIFDQVSRDFERTPFQWDSSINGGFNEGNDTWLPVSDKYNETNVDLESKTDRSHLITYKSLLEMRKEFTANDDTTTDLKDTVLIISRKVDQYTVYHYVYNREKGDSVEIDLPNVLNVQTYTIVASSLDSKKKVKDSVKQKLTLENNECLIVKENGPQPPTTTPKGSGAPAFLRMAPLRLVVLVIGLIAFLFY